MKVAASSRRRATSAGRWRCLTAALAAAVCAATVATPAQAAAAGYVSASSVEALDGDLSTVSPAVHTTYPGDPLTPSDYLKPMGPVGAHGYARNSNGQYVTSGGAVRRTYDVPYGPATRRYELYEFYDDTFARNLGYANDTSFMVEDSYLAPGSSVEYRFTSDHTQWVTINVLPMRMRYDLVTLSGYVGLAAANHLDYPTGAARGTALVDDFDLELIDDTGRVLARSNSLELADTIQVEVTAGTRLTVRVTYYQRGSYFGLHDGYRLFVTGSTPYIVGTDITGAHQSPVGTA